MTALYQRNARPGLHVLALVMIALLLPASAKTQDERSHDGGFFLRLSAGGGGASTEVTDGGTKYRYSGTAGDVNIAIGAIVSPDLAVHGTLFGWSITDPDIEIGNTSFGGTGDLSLGGVGGGVTWYFMPVNIYVSGSLGLARLSYQQGNLSGHTSAGLAFDMTIGKEWWVGDSWGLGVALGLGMHSVPEEGVADNWSGGSVGIRFSATMN